MISDKYIYLKKHGLFIPIAWVHRIFIDILGRYKLTGTIKNIQYFLRKRNLRRDIINKFEIPY